MTETPYCGPPPTPAVLWFNWNLDPVLIAGLVQHHAAFDNRSAIRFVRQPILPQGMPAGHAGDDLKIVGGRW